MKTTLEDILYDSSITVDEKVFKTAKLLSSFPDKGVSEIIRFMLTTDDPVAANYPTDYLALLPNFNEEKQQIVEYILNNERHLMIALVNLIKFMPDDVIERLINEYFKYPSSSDMYSILFEISNYFPGQLHKLASQIDDELIQKAILSGGPDNWVEDFVEKYRRNGDPSFLKALSCFHTDEALDAMFTLKPIVPEEEQENLHMYIESSGVFPDTRKASIYFKTYRGFVVSRDESSHNMGGGFPYPVPKCPICDTPSTRILTLDVNELDFDLESGHNPSFFWYNCPHSPSYIVVRFMEDGIEGMMTPLTDGPVDTDFIPGKLALLLEEHPNQYGIGLEATPGFSNHQVGGYPPWIKLDSFPRCPGCRQGMRFLASIDSGMTPFGKLPFDGIIYGFWCDDCAISVTFVQNV